MKAPTKLLLLTMMGLAFLLPIASVEPDGLQRVAQSLGVMEGMPLWEGIVPLFAFAGFSGARVVAGLVGILLTFAIAWVTASLVSRRKKE